jgi:dienelactone hydrolase
MAFKSDGLRPQLELKKEKGPILESWKEIAAHLKRNVRTCQLWERDHGLPIHRLDGSPKARVFAYPEEIDRWFKEKLHERDSKPGRRQALPAIPRWNLGLIAGLSVVAAVAVTASAWLIVRQARVGWANDVAIPEIERLLMASDTQKPFELAKRVEKIEPGNERLSRIMPLIAGSLTVETNPAGAEVSIRAYGRTDLAWESLGRAPAVKVRLAQGYKHWRVEKPGYAPAEGCTYILPGDEQALKVKLDRLDQAPPGMVRVAGQIQGLPYYRLFTSPGADLKDYWIDRYEVTNRQYRAFVDAGGYRDPRYWKFEFRKDGRTLSWKDAMALFVDRTDRPGPANWELGACPPGTMDSPVTGVSWYEAAAFAEYAGKRLPSAYHWTLAAGIHDGEFVIPLSNFQGRGLAAVGAFKGLGRFGTYDMAGNAKEWCSNDVEGKRACLGGAWNEAQYWFENFDAYPPYMRGDNFSFRCILLATEPGVTTAADEALTLEPETDFSRLAPCSDDVFRAYQSLYSFTRTPLEARVESRQEWSEETIIEKVSYADAEGTDRVIAYLFLPRQGRPPFQSVVYFPGSGANFLSSVFDYGTVKSREVELFTRGGRAFIFPVFWNTFERKIKTTPERTRQFLKDRMIRHHRELVRTLDYLETRPDLDKDKIAYQGLSWGAWAGPLHVALEKRFKAANFLGGGFYWEMYVPERGSPEWDAANFAPRVAAPVLMQNGQFDVYFDLETNVRPLFRLLGTPEKDKSLRVYPSGHSVWLLNEYRKDISDFFDRYLGPVKK